MAYLPLAAAVRREQQVRPEHRAVRCTQQRALRNGKVRQRSLAHIRLDPFPPPLPLHLLHRLVLA